LFFPFFSFFATVGVFILGFWFLGFAILAIKNKEININLLIGFIVLCVGFVLVDLRNFYVLFVLKTELNRSIFSFSPSIKQFFRHWFSYGMNGYYHASSFQRLIIIPVAFIVSFFALLALINRIAKMPGKLTTRIKIAIAETDKTVKQLFIIELAIVALCIIAAFHDSYIIAGFIENVIPLLKGFNWGRVWIFNRVLWYIVFAYCIRIILYIEILHFDITHFNFGKFSIIIPNIFFRICVGWLIVLQFGYILLSPVEYNDQVKTWFNEIFIKNGIAEKLFPNRTFNSFVSYKDFYFIDLFDKIKEDISYSHEKVVSFGYHPSILWYNGFNTIDGYMNSYPLDYMRKFRTLIAPELEKNQWAREYFDSWGGRMYLYNSELGYSPIKNKQTTPVNLNIDMDVFKNIFNGVYILSRAEISNSDDLGLVLVNHYWDKNSIYTIYLYKS
jgi:hypothetical protein